MTGMRYAVDLRETHGQHVVRRHVLAEDLDHARVWIDLWSGCGSTRAGRTEVAVRPLTCPTLPEPEPDLHLDLHPQPGQPGLPLPAGVDGWPLGGRREVWPNPAGREP